MIAVSYDVEYPDVHTSARVALIDNRVSPAVTHYPGPLDNLSGISRLDVFARTLNEYLRTGRIDDTGLEVEDAAIPLSPGTPEPWPFGGQR